MRAKEFIQEYIDDLHTWITMAKNDIVKKVDNGEIPNNPDSIKNAAKELAVNLQREDEGVGVDTEMLAAEVEHQLFLDKMKTPHLSGFR